jgi:hypothetical protein
LISRELAVREIVLRSFRTIEINSANPGARNSRGRPTPIFGRAASYGEIARTQLRSFFTGKIASENRGGHNRDGVGREAILKELEAVNGINERGAFSPLISRVKIVG